MFLSLPNRTIYSFGYRHTHTQQPTTSPLSPFRVRLYVCMLAFLLTLRFPRPPSARVRLLSKKWLLAMLCYRFALRISHHTRQSWCRGSRTGKDGGGRGSSSSSAGSHGPVDVSPHPGPEVVRQLLKRQRHLLENSLQLLEVRKSLFQWEQN